MVDSERCAVLKMAASDGVRLRGLGVIGMPARGVKRLASSGSSDTVVSVARVAIATTAHARESKAEIRTAAGDPEKGNNPVRIVGATARARDLTRVGVDVAGQFFEMTVTCAALVFKERHDKTLLIEWHAPKEPGAPSTGRSGMDRQGAPA